MTGSGSTQSCMPTNAGMIFYRSMNHFTAKRSMITSPNPSSKSEAERFGRKDAVGRAYHQERLISDMYDFVVGKFLEKEAAGRLSRADLARSTGTSPAQVSRWLGAPTNWTLSTVASLLLAISEERLVPESESIHTVGTLRNAMAYDMLRKDTSQADQRPAELQDTGHDLVPLMKNADSDSDLLEAHGR